MKKMIGSKFINTVRGSDWDVSLDLFGLIITEKYYRKKWKVIKQVLSFVKSVQFRLKNLLIFPT